jgi:hypothetical protein
MKGMEALSNSGLARQGMSAFYRPRSTLESPLQVCNISQTCPINSLRTNYFEIHFNIILIYRPGSPKRSPQAQFKEERDKLATVKFPHSTPGGTWKSRGSFTHLTLTLDRGERSVSRPGRFTPEKEVRHVLNTRLGWPQSRFVYLLVLW